MNQDDTFKMAYPFNVDVAINALFQETFDELAFFGEGLFEEDTDVEAFLLD